MPRTRSLAWAELKIGMVTVFALVMAGILIFAVGGGSFFWQQYHLKAIFPNVAGLKGGSPVRLAGVEIGSVTDVGFVGTGVEVWFEVSNDQQKLITTDSMASIGSISLLGEGSIDITPAATGTAIPEWGYIRSGTAEGTFASVTEEATAGMREVRTLLQDVRSGKGTIGKLFTDDAVYRDVNRFVQAAERVTTAVAQGRGTLGKLTQDPALYNELQASVANLREITNGIKSGDGSLGRLVNDPALAESLTATTKNLQGVTDRLNSGEGTAGRLLTDAQLYTRLNSMADRLDQITSRLSAGEGTAGQLLQNKQLYENMNQTVGELRSLLTDIRKDPKKYLTVRVSIF